VYLRQRRLPGDPRDAGHHLQHEPPRRLLPQGSDGELLLDSEERTRRALYELRRGEDGALRLHRGVIHQRRPIRRSDRSARRPSSAARRRRAWTLWKTAQNAVSHSAPHSSCIRERTEQKADQLTATVQAIGSDPRSARRRFRRNRSTMRRQITTRLPVWRESWPSMPRSTPSSRFPRGFAGARRRELVELRRLFSNTPQRDLIHRSCSSRRSAG
jgi:hypothetical protein